MVNKQKQQETRKIVRENNKRRYHEDPEYRRYQQRKGRIYGLARSWLIANHRKEFEELLKKAEKKL